MKRLVLAPALLLLAPVARPEEDPVVADVRARLRPLLSVRVETAPVADGVADDVWSVAPAARVGEEPTVQVRSVHTAERIHFLVEWPDERLDVPPATARGDSLRLAFLEPGSNEPYTPFLGWASFAEMADSAGRWHEGRLTVELHRALEPDRKGDVVVRPGKTLWVDVGTTSAMRMPGDGGHGVLEMQLVRALAADDFEAAETGKPPPGFRAARTGGGAAGEWRVVEALHAPSGRRVVAQTSADATSYRFPVLVREGTSTEDAFVSTRFRTVSGATDRAAGLVVRFRDGDYYVARANALEGNVRLYRVVGGKREQLAGADVPVSAGDWHELALEARGRHLRVLYEGRLLLEADDEAIPGPGLAGLWTKADSVTWFDDLTVLALDGPGVLPARPGGR